MGDRFFLSEQEIELKYGQPVMKIGHEWIWSNIYYDMEQDRFVEERWHNEYLDTGIICDGCFPISDLVLWERLVSTVDEQGISAFLQIRKAIPKVMEKPPFLSQEKFDVDLRDLNENGCFYHLLKIGDVYVIRNEKGENIGIVSKSSYCFFYVDRGNAPKGFHSLEKALSYAMTMITEYHQRRIPSAKPMERVVPPGAERENETPGGKKGLFRWKKKGI